MTVAKIEIVGRIGKFETPDYVVGVVGDSAKVEYKLACVTESMTTHAENVKMAFQYLIDAINETA